LARSWFSDPARAAAHHFRQVPGRHERCGAARPVRPAILLSFSRAAWGQVVYCSLVVLALTFVTTRSSSHRLRLVLLSVTGVVVLTGFIGALLSIGRRCRPVQAARQLRAELRSR